MLCIVNDGYFRQKILFTSNVHLKHTHTYIKSNPQLHILPYGINDCVSHGSSNELGVRETFTQRPISRQMVMVCGCKGGSTHAEAASPLRRSVCELVVWSRWRLWMVFWITKYFMNRFKDDPENIAF